ncbi:MAG TPA: c-type cytochrome [Rhizomicrobium sp.]|nr:c-type cytochrome [Rhizomicrobium sp.]
MRNVAILLGFSLLTLGGAALAQEALPYWAYPVPTHKWPQIDPHQKHRLPGSNKTLSYAAVNDRFRVPDWHPGDHPAMPDIVALGRKPDVPACGYCHLPNGQGKPENASLAGLPADYIVQQVKDMREGTRQSSTDKMNSIKSMLALAKASNDAEVKIAADYFAKLKYKKWIRVVETDTVPKTDIAQRNMLIVVPGPKEPIGKRILEVPENLEHIEWRGARQGFIAYVPKGAIARGKTLVETGAGAFPCAACHGPELKGNGNVPALAGRSPSGLVRQLYDFKSGKRNGPGAAMMKSQVANMTDDMRLDIAAYLASLNP